jgi:hypothetical protein
MKKSAIYGRTSTPEQHIETQLYQMGDCHVFPFENGEVFHQHILRQVGIPREASGARRAGLGLGGSGPGSWTAATTSRVSTTCWNSDSDMADGSIALFRPIGWV